MPTTLWTGKGTTFIYDIILIGHVLERLFLTPVLVIDVNSPMPHGRMLTKVCDFLSRYPWGEEAFEKAKLENKLIFLSGEVKLYTCWTSIFLSFF